MSRPWAHMCGPPLWTFSISWLVWLSKSWGLCGLVGFSLAVSSRLFRIFGRARLLLVVALILPQAWCLCLLGCLMSRGTLACLLPDSNFQGQAFFCLFFRHTLCLCSCERGPISQTGFSRRVFLFRQEFSFSQSYRFFFPSFCQALAEDRVTTPTKKK